MAGTPTNEPEAFHPGLIKLAWKGVKLVGAGALYGTGEIAAKAGWDRLQRCPKCHKPRFLCKCKDGGKATA